MGIFKKTTKKEAAAPKASKPVAHPELVERAVAKSAKPAVAKAAAPVVTRDDMRAYKLLQAPVITERVTDLNMLNKYAFAVPVTATKSEVKKTIANVYGIKPTAVNMIRVRGNKVRFGRTMGRQKKWKKAIVTLPAGKTIEVYEGV